MYNFDIRQTVGFDRTDNQVARTRRNHRLNLFRLFVKNFDLKNVLENDVFFRVFFLMNDSLFFPLNA